MNTIAKAANYTQEQTDAIVADYKSGATVEAIAEKMGRTGRSIIAKLSREGVYTPKAKAAKADTKASMGKADMAVAIVTAAGMTADEAKDLTKLTKQTLVNLLAAVSRE